MSTFDIENNIIRSEIKSMILASLTSGIRDLIKFDSTFTLNPYESIIIENIIQPEVKTIVSKIIN